MAVKFAGTPIFVRDISKSKTFYSDLIGLAMKADIGIYIMYENGFSLWGATEASKIIFGVEGKTAPGARSFEVYLETGEVVDTFERIRKSDGVEFIHELTEFPWAQRGFRIIDPDGNSVEISEPMPQVVQRLKSEGLSVEKIAEKNHVQPRGDRNNAGAIMTAIEILEQFYRRSSYT